MERYRIMRAERCDLQEILALQYLAYQSEAELFGTRDIPPLKQTPEELECEHDAGVILKPMCGSGIIGSDRARREDATAYIGKLSTPGTEGRGWGKCC